MLKYFGLFTLTLVTCVLSCTKESDVSNNIKLRCKELTSRACDPDCEGGKFNKCHYDGRQPFDNKSFEASSARERCVAMHVGSNCAPCENIFALNFAGAIREVGCEEYLEAIDKRNKNCDN